MVDGRADERKALREALVDARNGRSRTVVVRGEPGMGKTTLLDELMTGATDMFVLRTTGVEVETALPYAGLHALLRPVRDLVDQLPALRTALGYSDGTADRMAVALAVLTLLAEAAERQPVLVALDDAQWLDQPSLDAIAFVARRLHADRVAIVAAARPPLSGVDTLADLPELWLAGLDAAAAGQLLDEEGIDLAPRVRDVLLTETGGNPLGLVELARQLSTAERAGLRPLPTPIPLGRHLQEAFARDAAGLPAPSRTILLVAAAEECGDLDIVAEAAATLGAGVDDFAPAERAGLIHLAAATVRFRHPLIRTALYWEAAFAERAAAHQAVADALQHAGKTDQAAWHRAIATAGPDKAIAYGLEEAAESMLRRGGAATAAVLLHRAASLSETVADRARRLIRAAGAAYAAGHLDQAHDLLDEARPLADDTADIGALLARVEKEAGSPAVAYQSGIRVVPMLADRPDDAVSVLLLMTGAAWDRNDPNGMTTAARMLTEVAQDTECEPLGAMLESLATTGSVPAVAAEVTPLRDAAEALFALDKPETWLWPAPLAFHAGHLHLAYQFAQQVTQRLRTARMPGLLTGALSPLIRICQALGRWGEADALITEGLLLCRDTGQSSRAASLHAARALLAAERGDIEQCGKAASEALATALPRGIAVTACQAVWARGTLAASLGKPDEAHRELSDLFCVDGPYTHYYFKRPATVEYVDACVRLGRTAEAESVVAEFETWAEKSGLRWAHAHVQRCRALLGTDDTERCFEQALHTGYEGLPFQQARTALQFGEWLRRERRPSQAQVHLRAALETFEGLGAATWAAVAGTQLRSAGGQFHRGSGTGNGGAPLTAQELQVAKLAATGLSNPEIAGQLFISHRTVGYHLSKIYAKLGISTRRQLRDLDSEVLHR